MWLLFVATTPPRRRKEGDADAALIHRTARGDTAALEVLHQRYYQRLYKVALVKVGSVDDAHDLASETFLRAVQNVRRLDPLQSGSLYPWLYTVLGNLIVDHYRRAAFVQVEPDLSGAEELSELFEALPDQGPLPEEVVSRHQVQGAVRAVLQQLPDAQAAAVFYRFVGGMSLREIAEVMDKSEGAVKSLLHRGMLSLRQRVQAAAAQRRATLQQEREQSRDADRGSIGLH